MVTFASDAISRLLPKATNRVHKRRHLFGAKLGCCVQIDTFPSGLRFWYPTAIRLVVSLIYWALRRLLELVVLRLRSERSKELEILVLRHQLQVLHRQVAQPRLGPADRVLLAALSRSLPRSVWSSFLVSPATLCAGIGS
jgi:hypothetical protein